MTMKAFSLIGFLLVIRLESEFCLLKGKYIHQFTVIDHNAASSDLIPPHTHTYVEVHLLISQSVVPSLRMRALFLVWVAASLRPHMFSEKTLKKYSFPTTSSVIAMQLRW